MSELLTPADLEQETGVPERTWEQWRYLGRGPAFVKLGKHVRYRRVDLDSWLESQRHGGPDAPAA